MEKIIQVNVSYDNSHFNSSLNHDCNFLYFLNRDYAITDNHNIKIHEDENSSIDSIRNAINNNQLITQKDAYSTILTVKILKTFTADSKVIDTLENNLRSIKTLHKVAETIVDSITNQ